MKLKINLLILFCLIFFSSPSISQEFIATTFNYDSLEYIHNKKDVNQQIFKALKIELKDIADPGAEWNAGCLKDADLPDFHFEYALFDANSQTTIVFLQSGGFVISDIIITAVNNNKEIKVYKPSNIIRSKEEFKEMVEEYNMIFVDGTY